MKENKYIRFLIFLIANFSALAIGAWLMNEEPRTDWYLSLNKAPWTPAGWVFGVAWTTIMVLFSVYMTKVSFQYEFLNRKVLILYIDQWVLNVSWNYIFFNQHLTKLGLVVIVLLWLLIGYFTFEYLKKIKRYTLFILPYLIWMTIAVSLNAYIVFNN
ncbi:TspO/MBR family protein [Tenacibaculum caenipelagi]|uniref:TspO/MBR related protein n=1 Tax=Tenacibaculum caenipelagi TaxID=1325435 RepID=A0A4R6T9I3_9FLAO|nr:TspO/MBR family protein [Tenacibaculum caenipelagi]TDQ21863.1 TspO/MBR related protein [Tenacibaculum caenipelagi]